MDNELFDFLNEIKATDNKETNKQYALRQAHARRKIEIINELKTLGLDSTELILIM
ncbi:hypothetical protein [Photobacterium phosphoreum]|uniref:hypothetical protein n=1 Tax=Photobacterium phosphoreum TaxID=659 RepID=UPI0015E7D6CC|nr:hypothetical protein [Photobacterium phosphoreum]